MKDITLIFPNQDMELMALEFKKEFFDYGEKTINGSYKFDMDKYTYSEWLQIIKDNLDGERVNPKFGLSHTLFAVNTKKQIVGIVNFRHILTDFYRDSGHIGYSVRPLERNKGYATEILRQILILAKEKGLKEVFLVCKKNNISSKKTIIKNNGFIKREFSNDGVEYEEYQIIL